jgi:hypothetical protein
MRRRTYLPLDYFSLGGSILLFQRREATTMVRDGDGGGGVEQ